LFHFINTHNLQRNETTKGTERRGSVGASQRNIAVRVPCSRRSDLEGSKEGCDPAGPLARSGSHPDLRSPYRFSTLGNTAKHPVRYTKL